MAQGPAAQAAGPVTKWNPPWTLSFHAPAHRHAPTAPEKLPGPKRPFVPPAEDRLQHRHSRSLFTLQRPAEAELVTATAAPAPPERPRLRRDARLCRAPPWTEFWPGRSGSATRLSQPRESDTACTRLEGHGEGLLGRATSGSAPMGSPRTERAIVGGATVAKNTAAGDSAHGSRQP